MFYRPLSFALVALFIQACFSVSTSSGTPALILASRAEDGSRELAVALDAADSRLAADGGGEDGQPSICAGPAVGTGRFNFQLIVEGIPSEVSALVDGGHIYVRGRERQNGNSFNVQGVLKDGRIQFDCPKTAGDHGWDKVVVYLDANSNGRCDGADYFLKFGTGAGA